MLICAVSTLLAHAAPEDPEVYTWEGDVSSDMADNDNWVGSPAVDFITGNDQWVFGASLGSVAPQLGPGDGESVSWAGQTADADTTTAILFDVDAPAYIIGNNGDTARAVGLWTSTDGSADVVNNSGNTQTFNTLVRQRRSTINAAAGDIVFNGEFRVGDAQTSTAYSAIFKGDDDIYLNGPVTGYTGTSSSRSRIFYQGASTTAENAGRLILGDIGTDYLNTIIVDSALGGAVVATHNNSLGAFDASSAKLGTQIGLANVFSNGAVELDGSGGDITTGENFRLAMRTQANGATHIRNVAGNNTISGFVSFNMAGETGADAAYFESLAGSKLTITGAYSNDRPAVTSVLFLKGDGDFDIGGALGIVQLATAGTSTNVDKSGDGTVTTLLGTSNDYTGTTTIHDGSFIVNGTHTAVSAGAYNVESLGTLGGSGSTVSSVNLSGKLAPGEVTSVGTFTVGGLSLTGGILDFQLNATDDTAGSDINDLLINTGALDLTGGATLNVTGIGGDLMAGDYELIQFPGGHTGIASDIALGTIPLASGLSASILIDADSVNLHVGVGLMGDFNGDGFVDAADYVFWRKNLGDDTNYNKWRTNFGTGSGAGNVLSGESSTLVPEPASALLMAFAITALCLGIAPRRRTVA